MIARLWDRLADECKRRRVDAVQANLPMLCDVDETDEIDERGE